LAAENHQHSLPIYVNRFFPVYQGVFILPCL
jgi:hypothetical protein